MRLVAFPGFYGVEPMWYSSIPYFWFHHPFRSRGFRYLRAGFFVPAMTRFIPKMPVNPWAGLSRVVWVFRSRLRFRCDCGITIHGFSGPVHSIRNIVAQDYCVVEQHYYATTSCGERPTLLIRVATGGTHGGSVFQPGALLPLLCYSSKTVFHFEEQRIAKLNE